MSRSKPGSYDPRTFKGLTFHDAAARFREGADTPRAYLERCLETIAEREPAVKAFVTLNEAGARAAADQSSARWKAGKPLSPIDGMPLGIKDLLETRDMPTQMGCAAYAGNFPRRDNAAVWALREAGAIILGKTVTAELGGSQPGPTRNPFSEAHSPGGSSSGTAAAIGARMVPAGLGTQIAGSIIRPSAFCGGYALKPTQGAINRGERQATSMSTHGAHAACLEDVWQVSIEIAERAGGDRGFYGLSGPRQVPPAVKPERLIVLETPGWERIDDATKSAFEMLLRQIEAKGVRVIRRTEAPLVEKLEGVVAGAEATCNAIIAWEGRWALRNLVDATPEGVSARGKAGLAKAEAMSVADYRAALIDRETSQIAHARIAPIADAAISLSCPGPAPEWSDAPETLRPTGDPIFNYAASLLFAPAVTLPLLGVRGLPVGVQLMGQQHEDARMLALGRWVAGAVTPVAVE